MTLILYSPVTNEIKLWRETMSIVSAASPEWLLTNTIDRALAFYAWEIVGVL